MEPYALQLVFQYAEGDETEGGRSVKKKRKKFGARDSNSKVTIN